jgi:hypothetical protein
MTKQVSTLYLEVKIEVDVPEKFVNRGSSEYEKWWQKFSDAIEDKIVNLNIHIPDYTGIDIVHAEWSDEEHFS